MVEMMAKVVREGRRAYMLTKKRLNLTRYTWAAKTQLGQNPDFLQDAMRMQVKHKSLNLLDFERNREMDLFMLDVSSDRSEYGGTSETELSIMQDSDGDTYCK